jgi:5-methylcytosine-specific restriction endonuclease McrA
MMKSKRKFKLNGKLKGICHTNLIQNRRDTIYKMLGKKKDNDGKVPCFVCKEHVDYEDATLEHVTPQSLGGTDEMDNLSISHELCNKLRGNKTDYVFPYSEDEQ